MLIGCLVLRNTEVVFPKRLFQKIQEKPRRMNKFPLGSFKQENQVMESHQAFLPCWTWLHDVTSHVFGKQTRTPKSIGAHSIWVSTLMFWIVQWKNAIKYHISVQVDSGKYEQYEEMRNCQMNVIGVGGNV